MFSHPYISHLANERLQGKELPFGKASRDYTLYCGCKCYVPALLRIVAQPCFR